MHILKFLVWFVGGAPMGWKSGSRLHSWLLDTSLVLWICRISVASLLFGILLFIFAPQTQDTFLEVHGHPAWDSGNIFYWGSFFFLAILVWVLPVHYSARWNLEHDRALHPRPKTNEKRLKRLRWLERWVPRALGAACLLAVAFAAFKAGMVLTVPTPDGEPGQGGAFDLAAAARLQAGLLSAVSVLLATGLLAFFRYRRPLLRQLNAHGIGPWPKFSQNLLIALTVLFVLLFFLPVSVVEALKRGQFLPFLLGAWVAPLGWLAWYGRKHSLPLVAALILTLELFTVFGNNHNVRTVAIDETGKPFVASSERADTALTAEAKSSSIGKNEEPREGLYRPFFNDAVALWRAENCLKTADTATGKAAGAPTNETCATRPIIVAASGGASRASFFTSAVLGELEDRTLNDTKYRPFHRQLFAISSVSGSSTGAAFFVAALMDAQADQHRKKGATSDGNLPGLNHPCRSKAPLWFSTEKIDTWRECMEVLSSGDFLSVTLSALLYRDTVRGFISILNALGANYTDRAGVLEHSWEAHYCHVLESCDGGEKEYALLERLYLSAGPSPQDSIWRPLLFLNATDVDTGKRIIVSPVRVKGCGKDSPAEGCDENEPIFNDAYDLHHLIADMGGLRRPGQTGVEVERGLTQDIRLSTAAGLSARFPVVSPAGDLINEKGHLVGRVVDGGYYENFGATTALEIAERLREQHGLNPIIIQITNEPTLLGPPELEPTKSRKGKRISMHCQAIAKDPVCERAPIVVTPSQSTFFSTIRNPVSGLLGARQAQGGTALLRLAAFHRDAKNSCPNASASGPKPPATVCEIPMNRDDVGFVHYYVRPQYELQTNYVRNPFGNSPKQTCVIKNVSMSWWLSKPVQNYLDHEVSNSNFDPVLKALLYGSPEPEQSLDGRQRP